MLRPYKAERSSEFTGPTSKWLVNHNYLTPPRVFFVSVDSKSSYTGLFQLFPDVLILNKLSWSRSENGARESLQENQIGGPGESASLEIKNGGQSRRT